MKNARTIITAVLALVCMMGQAQEPFFSTDSAVVRGRIVHYSPSMGFQSLSAMVPDVFTDKRTTVTAEIHEDGTFEKHLLLHHPILNWFYTDQEHIGAQQIPFYLCPGDTLDITVRFNDSVIPDCEYRGGHATDVARLLKVRYDELPLLKTCLTFEGDIEAFNRFADSLYTVQVREVNEQADRLHFTPFERRLALCDLAGNWGSAYLSYFRQIRDKVTEKDPTTFITAGNAMMERLSQTENYPLLKRLPNEDSLMLATRFFNRYLNRLQWSSPMRYPLNEKRGGSWEDSRENVIEELSLYRDAGRRLFASTKDLLPIQLLQLHCLNGALGDWFDNGTAEEDFHAVQPFFTHHAVSKMAQQFYDEMAEEVPTLPLPEGEAADFIRSILRQYPNRYIILDFWAMWCAPCKMEIQSTKDFRQSMRARSDLMYIFLANEQNPQDKTYLDFVNENLKDEVNIVIDDNRFRQLQDLFGFAGIPFGVTLTPDGRIVRDGLRLHDAEAGYDLFIEIFEEMKKKTTDQTD